MILFPAQRSGCALLLLLFTVANVSAQSVHTPAKDSRERKAIMDAIRVPCERELRQKVIFEVQKLRVAQEWAYAAVTPLTPDGAKIDYRKTQFKAQVDNGDFDPTGEALLRLKDGSWEVLKWRLGGTDVALLEWIDTEGAPKSLDSAQTTSNELPNSAETTKGLRTFLISAEGTYGWSPLEGGLSYDFLPDGRLHLQGADGEASMSEGKWRLEGNQLTLVSSDKKTTRTVTVAKQGEELLLGEKRYRRYRP